MDGNSDRGERALDWRLIVAAGLWCLTATAAILLTARAAAGALDAPVTAAVPGLLTAIATLGSLGAWRLFHLATQSRCVPPNVSTSPLVAGLLSLTAPALIAWATTVSASPLAAGVVMGILVLGLTFVIVSEGLRQAPAASDLETVPADARVAVKLREDSPAERRSEPPKSINAELVQQLSRRREADGSERIEAVVQATFAPGERETVVHLPIHPALRGTPQVECEPLDDHPVTTTVTAAHPYGVRVEVKRTSAIETSLKVPVGIELCSTDRVADVA
ncbi:MAG: hypothetical protein AB7I48_26250 [Planctomycetaceae bacterium]